MIHEFNQLLHVETPLGDGIAILIIDYGPQVNTCWVVALEENGAIKHFDANQIKLCKNDTYSINLKSNLNGNS
jgi:hypothetical protein